MFRLGVVSDSHGNQTALRSAANALKDVDAVAHLGDHQSDSRFFARAGRQLFTVSGNCDGWRCQNDEIVANIEGHKVYMCHGHAFYVKLSLTRLSLRAQESGCDIVLYGHTHIPSVDADGGIIFVNPGALTDGRYCIVEFRENGPVPELYTL